MLYVILFIILYLIISIYLSIYLDKDSFVYNEVDGNKFDDLYPMYDDNGMLIPGIAHNCFGGHDLSLCLSHLVALIVIKLRIFVTLEIKLHVELKKNASYDTRNVKTLISTQKCLLNKYLHMTHKKNKYILPIFSNIDNIKFMKSQGSPEYYGSNSPEEAFFVMEDYCRHFGRIPLLGSGENCYFLKFLREIDELQTPDLTYKS